MTVFGDKAFKFVRLLGWALIQSDGGGNLDTREIPDKHVYREKAM